MSAVSCSLIFILFAIVKRTWHAAQPFGLIAKGFSLTILISLSAIRSASTPLLPLLSKPLVEHRGISLLKRH
jgi:hypothetical protein